MPAELLMVLDPMTMVAVVQMDKKKPPDGVAALLLPGRCSGLSQFRS